MRRLTVTGIVQPRVDELMTQEAGDLLLVIDSPADRTGADEIAGAGPAGTVRVALEVCESGTCRNHRVDHRTVDVRVIPTADLEVQVGTGDVELR